MICNNCGSRNNDDDSICVNCGAALSDERSKNNHSKKKIIGIAVSCICMVAMIIAAILIVSNVTSTKDLEEAIATKDAYNVNYVYSQAYDKESKLKKYDKIIGNTISEIKDDINNHNFENEALEYGEEAVPNYCKSKWGTLVLSEESVNIESSISSGNRESWGELNSLLESKANYCDGLYFKVEQKYGDAIENFSLVIEKDSNYEDAKAKINECFEEYADAVLKAVEEKISAGDISGAILMLETDIEHMKELGMNSEEIENRLDSVLLEYAKSYADKAENCFKEKDINGAIGNIEVAMELAPNNADFKTKHDTYEQYIPFYLYDEDNVLSFSPHKQIKFYGNNEYIEAVNKDHYVSCINYRYFSGSDNGIIKYTLDGKYDTVTGVFFSPRVNVQANRTGSCYFVVYGDGKEIYHSDIINAESKPIQISFNVKDIQNLEIEFIGSNSSVYGVGTYSYGDYAAISELTAQKNFPE